MIGLNITGMISVLNIIHDSIVDGNGLRTVIFFSGCSHRCNQCQNPQGWDINNGNPMSIEEIIIKITVKRLSKNITFSGGDPFYQSQEVQHLASKLKELEFNIWAYTGYTFEQLLDESDLSKINLLGYCDVLVDGRFEANKKDLTLPFRGSSNQRIIDVQKSLKERLVVNFKI